VFGHEYRIGDGPVYPKGRGIGKMLGNNKQNIGGKRHRCKWKKERKKGC
jgi:hypothetical protein